MKFFLLGLVTLGAAQLHPNDRKAPITIFPQNSIDPKDFYKAEIVHPNKYHAPHEHQQKKSYFPIQDQQQKYRHYPVRPGQQIEIKQWKQIYPKRPDLHIDTRPSIYPPPVIIKKQQKQWKQYPVPQRYPQYPKFPTFPLPEPRQHKFIDLPVEYPMPIFPKYDYYVNDQQKPYKKSFIHEVKKASRQFDPKNILKREQRQKQEQQEKEKQNQQFNWDQWLKKFYFYKKYYYPKFKGQLKYDQYDAAKYWKTYDDYYVKNWNTIPVDVWNGYDDFYKEFKHKIPPGYDYWKKHNHQVQEFPPGYDHWKRYKDQVQEFPPGYDHWKKYNDQQVYRFPPGYDHWKKNKNEQQQEAGVRPNPNLPKPYPEVPCQSQGCKKNHIRH